MKKGYNICAKLPGQYTSSPVYSCSHRSCPRDTLATCRRAWEKIEKDAEQLIAAARVTRTDYHAPFRALPYPSDKNAGNASAKASAAAVLGDHEDMAVRDNWDSSDDEEQEEKVEEEEEGGGQAGVAAEAEACAAGKEDVDVDDDPRVHEAAEREEEDGEKGDALEGPYAATTEATEATMVTQTAEGGEENNVEAPTEVSLSPTADVVLDGAGGRTTPESVAGPGERLSSSSLQWQAEDRKIDVEERVSGGGDGLTVSPALPSPPPATAAATTAAAAPSKRQSKWGNSMIKGRLSRPSDGRATTVEQEAAKRRERVEKLR